MESQQVEMASTKFTVDYIERALARAHNSEKLRVENFHLEVINQSGENFCSVIYRLKVEYRKSPQSLVEKGNYILKDLLPIVAQIGSNEKVMFEEVLPAMREILEKALPTTEHKLNANCLFTEIAASKEIYLLEDLGALGYVSMDRFKGIGVADAKICLHKMAQFHAASMILYQQQPKLVEKLSTSHYANGVSDPFPRVIVLDGTEFAADFMSEELPKIAKKMKAQLPDEYSKRMSSVVDPKNSAFNVIVHGDLWLNNMMMNKAQEKAIIVDFQNCFLGSPAIDIQFFFYTSLQLDVLLHQQDLLLQHYFDSLEATLKACQYTGSMPTFEQLSKEMERCAFYGYYGVVCELPICCVDQEASKDFSVQTFSSKEAMLEKRRQLFADERVRKTLKATLEIFDKQGILETP